MELAIILLLAPIVWGALCAGIIFAFVWILRRPIPTTWWLAALFGLVVVEFELVGILVGYGYEGHCSANTSIVEKVPKYRPCTLSEWRIEKLFPRFLGGVVWYWRGAAAVAYGVTFLAMHYRWRRQETRKM